MEPIAMVMRRLEWFGQVKRRDGTENIREVAEMKRWKCVSTTCYPTQGDDGER